MNKNECMMNSIMQVSFKDNCEILENVLTYALNVVPVFQPWPHSDNFGLFYFFSSFLSLFFEGQLLFISRNTSFLLMRNIRNELRY